MQIELKKYIHPLPAPSPAQNVTNADLFDRTGQLSLIAWNASYHVRVPPRVHERDARVNPSLVGGKVDSVPGVKLSRTDLSGD